LAKCNILTVEKNSRGAQSIEEHDNKSKLGSILKPIDK